MLSQKIIEINVAPHKEGEIKLDKHFFVIYVDDKTQEIVVEVYKYTGSDKKPGSGKLKFIFRGKNGIDIFREILKHDIITMMDHATYLGYELGRAEECLKSGKKYVQDG
jgi:thymidylate synthase